MHTNEGRKDIFWAYFAQFFQVSTGILILPIILRQFNSNEVAFYYLMLNFSALVLLFDFGFSSQFTRVFAYIFAGAQNIRKEGIEVSDGNLNCVNFRLLKTIIESSMMVYRVIGLLVLLVMTTFGTIYIYNVTDRFSLVEGSLWVWLLYSVSVFINMYYSFLIPMLIGKGDITASRKAIVYSKIVYILVSFTLLFIGLDLIAIVIANIVAPFVQRKISSKYFFTRTIKLELNKYNIERSEKISSFIDIWYNAKRMGLVMIGSFAINRTGLIIAGLYLPLDQVASYGLMQQVLGLIISISITLFTITQPRLARFLIQNEHKKLLDEFSFSIGIFYLLFFTSCVALVLVGPMLLKFIGSNTLLPRVDLLIFFCIVTLAEQNHSIFATLIALKNRIPYVVPSLISGVFIIVGTFVALAYLKMGIFGLIVVPAVVQISYNNWKWPAVIMKEHNLTFHKFFLTTLRITIFRLKAILIG